MVFSIAGMSGDSARNVQAGIDYTGRGCAAQEKYAGPENPYRKDKK
jgi:hypothetical protein